MSIKKWLRRNLPKIGLSLKSDLDYAYEQRDIAATLAFIFAHKAGYSVSKYQDDNVDWDPEWRTVLQITGLQKPGTGQISWHLGPRTQAIVNYLIPDSQKDPWDGTFWSRDVKTIHTVWTNRKR